MLSGNAYLVAWWVFMAFCGLALCIVLEGLR